MLSDFLPAQEAKVMKLNREEVPVISILLTTLLLRLLPARRMGTPNIGIALTAANISPMPKAITKPPLRNLRYLPQVTPLQTPYVKTKCPQPARKRAATTKLSIAKFAILK